MNKAIKLALKTWYPKSNNLHFDLKHPILKLAGECGELLDLYAKHQYKPNFDAWKCKHCQQSKENHLPHNLCNSMDTTFFTPPILDELGDIWYYIRILYYLEETRPNGRHTYFKDQPDKTIAGMLNAASQLSYNFLIDESFDPSRLNIVYWGLLDLLDYCNYTLDQLTKLNKIKLIDSPTNHGWKNA